MTDQNIVSLFFIVLGILCIIGFIMLFKTPVQEVDETEIKKKILGDNYNMMIDTQRLILHPEIRYGITDKIVFNTKSEVSNNDK